MSISILYTLYSHVHVQCVCGVCTALAAMSSAQTSASFAQLRVCRQANRKYSLSCQYSLGYLVITLPQPLLYGFTALVSHKGWGRGE